VWWAGGNGRTDRSPATTGAPSVCGPLGFSRPQGAVVFSDVRAHAKRPGSLDPRGRRNFKPTLFSNQVIREGVEGLRSPASSRLDPIAFDGGWAPASYADAPAYNGSYVETRHSLVRGPTDGGDR